MKRLFWDPCRLDQASNFETEISDQNRNLVFVGHGAQNDEAYLNKLGFSVATNKSVVRNMDTATLAGATKKSSVALQRLLLSLDLEPLNLHNAGNDAAYTLQALILMALHDYGDPGSVFSAVQARAGKLPPIVHSNIEAPHVFAGTAVEASLDPKIKSAVKPASGVAKGDPRHVQNPGRSKSQRKKDRSRLKRAMMSAPQGAAEAVDHLTT